MLLCLTVLIELLVLIDNEGLVFLAPFFLLMQWVLPFIITLQKQLEEEIIELDQKKNVKQDIPATRVPV